MGRKRVCPLEVLEQVALLHHQGRSYRQIGAAMQRAGILTPKRRPVRYAETSRKLLETKAGKAATARLEAADLEPPGVGS